LRVGDRGELTRRARAAAEPRGPWPRGRPDRRAGAHRARVPHRCGDPRRGAAPPPRGPTGLRERQPRDRLDLLPAGGDARVEERGGAAAPRGQRMSWRIATRHRSEYRYESPVVASYNEARITPLGRAGQRVLEAAVTVQPKTPLYRYRDYFGSAVVAF